MGKEVKYIAFHQLGICGVELKVPGYPATSTGNLVDKKLVREHAKAMAEVLNLAVGSPAKRTDLKVAVQRLKELQSKILSPIDEDSATGGWSESWTSEDC